MRNWTRRRWSQFVGSATFNLGLAMYLVAFLVPAWEREGANGPVEYSGLEAFFDAIVWGGRGGFAAWCANPLLWLALVVSKLGFARLSVALSGSAVALGVIGTLVFMDQYPTAHPLGGFVAWIAGIAGVGLGLLLRIIARRGLVRSPRL